MSRNVTLKKEILVVVSGLTPQVITETLYFLTQKKKPPIKISEIYVLTTKPGKALILSKLLEKRDGAFYSFCKEYGINPSQIKFDESTIRLFMDSSGKPLSDIKTLYENTAVANIITEFIKELSSEPHTRLHCSIAGGRKTMSLYLGYALQLFGKQNDSLYHVLISPRFEFHPDFFYKPRKNKILTYRDEKGRSRKINTRNAKIEMAEIPYVHLRGKLASIFGEENLSYTEMVSKVQSEIDSIRSLPDLVINTRERQVTIGDKRLILRPLELMILLHFAKQKLKVCKYVKRENCNECTECFVSANECTLTPAKNSMLKDYRNLFSKKSGLYQRVYDNWSDKEILLERIRENISRINSSLKTLHDSHFYLISSVRKYGDTRYGIRLDRSMIKLL